MTLGTCRRTRCGGGDRGGTGGDLVGFGHSTASSLDPRHAPAPSTTASDDPWGRRAGGAGGCIRASCHRLPRSLVPLVQHPPQVETTPGDRTGSPWRLGAAAHRHSARHPTKVTGRPTDMAPRCPWRADPRDHHMPRLRGAGRAQIGRQPGEQPESGRPALDPRGVPRGTRRGSAGGHLQPPWAAPEAAGRQQDGTHRGGRPSAGRQPRRADAAAAVLSDSARSARHGPERGDRGDPPRGTAT
jgi:hypothetical protein